MLEFYEPTTYPSVRTAIFLRLAGAVPWPNRVLRKLLALGGAQIHPSVVLQQRLTLMAGNLVYGANGIIAPDCRFDDYAPIVLGEGVGIAANCHFTTLAHDVGPPERRYGKLKLGPIKVGDGCWVGVGVTVLAGVEIGAGCIIAAGAVVTEDCAPNGLYAGVPARRKRDLPVPAERDLPVRAERDLPVRAERDAAATAEPAAPVPGASQAVSVQQAEED